MSRHSRCSIDCCHAWECCPRGIVERWKNFRYMREFTDIGIIEYWKWELECLIGMHKVKPDPNCKWCKEGECYEHGTFDQDEVTDMVDTGSEANTTAVKSANPTHTRNKNE